MEVPRWEHLGQPVYVPNFHCSAWIRAFMLYSTAAKLLFFMGSDIMKPKMSRLISQNFEQLMFLTVNSGVLKLSADKDW